MMNLFIKTASLSVLILSGIFVTENVCGQTIVRRDLRMESSVLNRPVEYSLILPDDYYKSNRKYPVLYLLHGFGGDNDSWLDRCNFNQLVDSLLNKELISEYIYVLPDAGNSYYINNYDSSNMYEDFFIKELLTHIDSSYRTSACSEERALMGLSMGGFGSIIMAVKYPEQFSSVVALSASVRDSAMFANLPQSMYDKYFASVFGPVTAGASRITEHWKTCSPYSLMDSTLAEQLKKIYWYIDCGMDDERLPANEAFHDLFMKYNVPHEFHMRPGNHNWAYWYRSAVYGLVFLNDFNESCQ
jgi:enterochelin esterase-like enzyme